MHVSAEVLPRAQGAYAQWRGLVNAIRIVGKYRRSVCPGCNPGRASRFGTPRFAVAADSSAASGAPLGLQAGFGVDIRLLPFDAPVAELVERDSGAGDRADHMVAVGQK